jgi:hypothetical protein
VADIGLRLQEGIQDLKLDQQLAQLAPAREAVARTFATGSTNFLKAVEGVRGRWAQRTASTSSPPPTAAEKSSRPSSPPVEVSKADLDGNTAGDESPRTATQGSFLRPFSLSAKSSPSTTSIPTSSSTSSEQSAASANGLTSPLSSWGANIGTFFSSTKLPFGRQQEEAAPAPANQTPTTTPAPGPAARSSSESHSTWGSLSALVSPPPLPRFNSLGAGGAGAGGTGLGAALAAKANSNSASSSVSSSVVVENQQAGSKKE